MWHNRGPLMVTCKWSFRASVELSLSTTMPESSMVLLLVLHSLDGSIIHSIFRA